MNENEGRERAFAMPLTSAADAHDPYQFVDREFLASTGYKHRTAARGKVVSSLLGPGFLLKIIPGASLPVLEVLSGVHILTDLTLGLGTLVHDYLEPARTSK